jgi:hypothetical protein
MSVRRPSFNNAMSSNHQRRPGTVDGNGESIPPMKTRLAILIENNRVDGVAQG